MAGRDHGVEGTTDGTDGHGLKEERGIPPMARRGPRTVAAGSLGSAEGRLWTIVTWRFRIWTGH